MQPSSTDPWPARLERLCAEVRSAARGAIAAATEAGGPAALERPLRRGAGDWTYGLDELSEGAVDRWLGEVAREEPLSLLTEDRGWRHLGPATGGGARELPGFDHGGPRIALDPIDGTRNLMADLRSAWTVVSFAGPGKGEPRLSELERGVVAEIPDSRAARYRVLSAVRGAPSRVELFDLGDGRLLAGRELAAGDDDRADHGYFPFFRYEPALRPEIARIEADFFERLREREGADTRHCFDDQYISNAGQLVLLALGTYRMVADLRAWLAAQESRATTTSKPYDLAGAVLCARSAGCAVTAPDGGELDFPLDCATPVSWVGWANAATERRLAPHLRAVLEDRPKN